jgi:putative transposase
MNRPKCDDLDYIHFLIAAQRVFTCTEAARCHQAPAHEAFTRLLQRQPPDTAALWQEAKAHVNLRKGLLHPGPTLRPEDGSGDLPRER